MVTINGKEYEAIMMTSKDTITVDFADLTVLECAEIGDNPQFDGTSISDAGAIKSMYIADDNGHLICTWTRRSDVEELRQELQEAENQIQERDSVLQRIRDAITDLGTGIPTLTKLTTFLSAVKEAIHYE